MPRRRRISLEKREQLLRAFEDGQSHEDYLVVADTIGVNRSTARVIVARYVRGTNRRKTAWWTKQRSL